MPPHARGLSPLTLGLLLLVTAGLAWEHTRLGIDPENRALKSVGTLDARRMAERTAAFGDERVAVAAVLSGAATTADPWATLDTLAELWRELPSVELVAEQPVEGDDVAVAAIVLRPREGEGTAALLGALRRRAAEELPPDQRLVLTGLPAAELAVARAVAAEQRRVVPAAGLVLFVLLLLAYRSLRLAAAAFVPALAGIFWIGGLFALLGHRLDPIASLLEPVVLTVGVAGAVHLVEAFRIERCRGRDRRASADAAVREIAFPALLTTATTVAGFLALTVHAIPAVRGFGLFAALGASIATTLTFLVTPEILALGRAADDPSCGPDRTETVCRTLAGRLARVAPWLTALALLAAAAGGVAWTRITVDTDPVSVLPADHPFRVDFENLARRLGGLETFDVMIRHGSSAAKPGALLLLERRLLDRPQIVDLGEALRESPRGDLLVTGILARAGTTERQALFDALDEGFARRGHGGVFCTGSTVQIARDSTRLVRGQLRALGLTLAVVFGAALLGFRSLRLALLALVPNAVPCVLLYGALAWLGRPLSVASAMIGSVMLGLICDDTIHVLHRYREARAGGAAPVEAVASALHLAGRAVTLTSIVLAGGFLAGLTGTLETTRSFAMLASAVIAMAWLGNVALAPALLLLPWGRRRPGRAHRPGRLPVPEHHSRWLPMAPLVPVVALVAIAEVTPGTVPEPAPRTTAPPPLERTLVDWPESAPRMPAPARLAAGPRTLAAGTSDGRTILPAPAGPAEVSLDARGRIDALRGALAGEASFEAGPLGEPGRAPVRLVRGRASLAAGGVSCEGPLEAGLAALADGRLYVEWTASAACLPGEAKGRSLFVRGEMAPAGE